MSLNDVCMAGPPPCDDFLSPSQSQNCAQRDGCSEGGVYMRICECGGQGHCMTMIPIRTDYELCTDGVMSNAQEQ